ncbi:hypothetical protein BHM03_00036694, partial [Ensete ventricosum]
MRLNHVESFYSFLLYFYSERSAEGLPATARPPTGVAGHSQAPCRGDHRRLGPYRGGRLRPGPPATAVAHGQPTRGNRQQAQPPAAKAVASRRGHPWAWLPLAGVAALVGAAPMEAPPSGTTLANKGGDYGHNARRSCRSMGNGACPPIGTVTPTTKGAARGQG